MILIADSGSTKTDWRLIDQQKNIYQFSTPGFNPFFQDSSIIAEELKKELLPGIRRLCLENIETEELKLHFYGAGCSSPDKCYVVENALLQVFPNAVIRVEHDLLAAARALCGNHKGIVAILGTGSNSCYYDGHQVAENVPSLGFILGDEGSGAYIGKAFLRDLLYGELPDRISEDFFRTYHLCKEDILDAVYKKKMPSRFLASFSRFIFSHKHEPLILGIVERCFHDFFKKHICKYKDHKRIRLSCVGSVAYYYSDILRNVAATHQVSIDKILESPISSLMLYHMENKDVMI